MAMPDTSFGMRSGMLPHLLHFLKHSAACYPTYWGDEQGLLGGNVDANLVNLLLACSSTAAHARDSRECRAGVRAA